MSSVTSAIRTAMFFLCVSAGAAGAALVAQASLTAKDYDDFYRGVILTARNGSEAEWLASYDAVVGFVAKVRTDVEALPEASRLALAKAVHDNGYWKEQRQRIEDPGDPMLGATFKASDEQLKVVLTPKGFDAYRNRYARGARGYRVSLDAVADRAALYKLEGKNVPRLDELPANTSILNANAQNWDDLMADARRFASPGERTTVIVANQLNAIASALALLRASQPRTDAEMDYATAVIWRYTGHYDGKDGWKRQPLIRIAYAELSEAEKAKDRSMWKAVRELLEARPSAGVRPQAGSSPPHPGGGAAG